MDRVLHAMSVFTHVVRLGSFTAAADALGVTAASTSTLVRQLEARLNVTLLQRSTRSMRLTTEGDQYYEHCLRILGEIADMEHSLGDAGKIARGKLSVDVDQEVAPLLLPLVAEFRVRYPEVDLQIGIGGDSDGLIGNGVDCAIVVGNLSDSSLRSRRIGTYHSITVASPRYLRKMGVPHNIDALRNHDFIHFIPKRFGMARHPRFSTEHNEITLRIPERISVNDASAVINYATSGLGLAQVCRSMSASEVRCGGLVEVLQDFRPRPLPIAVLYSDRRHMPMSVRAFIDWVSSKLSDGSIGSSEVTGAKTTISTPTAVLAGRTVPALETVI
jgi:LysR family transcriptional regulator, regulator for bpeEF and oprC